MKTNLFTQENIFSTLGIDINQDKFYIDFESSDIDDTWSNDFVSYLNIHSKDDHSHIFSSEHYEDGDLLSIKIQLKTFIVDDRFIIPCLPIYNKKVKKVVDLVNHYMKLFIIDYNIKKFDVNDCFFINLNVEYSNAGSLEIVSINSINTKVYKHYDCFADCIELDLEEYINNILKPLGISHLAISSDIDHIVELLKMQSLVEEMYDI